MDGHNTTTEVIDDLLVAIGRGDQRGFKKLYDAISPMLLGLLIKMVKRREIAEEILQECFIKIWQKACVFDPSRGRAISWITTLVRNQALDYIRARRPDQNGLDWSEELQSLIDDRTDPYRDAVTTQQLASACQAIDTLPSQMRTCVLLTYYSGHTHIESAAALKAPLGTIKSWARRGLGKVQSDLALMNIGKEMA